MIGRLSKPSQTSETTTAGAPAPDAAAPELRETAYTWDLASDSLTWCGKGPNALALSAEALPATGAAFSDLISDEHTARHANSIANSGETDTGAGVAYVLNYRIAPHGPRTPLTLWIEDRGRWWAGVDGRPSTARGVLTISFQPPGPNSRFGADLDELTGQLSRRRLTDALDTVITRTKREQTSAALLMISVNNLQQINETFGFDVGDQILTEVSKRTAAVLRGGDTIGRYSSNKFGVILNDCSRSALKVASDRILDAATRDPVELAECPMHASISIGAVLVPVQAETVSSAITGSLRALEQARAVHGSRIAFYETDGARESKRAEAASIATRISRAIAENRLQLALQEIVRSGSRTPAIYECLLRLDEPGETPMSAAVFVPIAEELGLSGLIDRRTLEMAVDLLQQDPDIRLSLNVSALTSSDLGWRSALEAKLGGRPDLAGRLIVELTETIALKDLEETARFVDAVRSIGCRVAIDDFGAGYTSFANLKRLDIDILKIDGSFIRKIVDDPSDQMFLRMMVELAEKFGLETVAEWVVDEPTAAMVEQMGVTYLQGFHFSEPSPARDVMANRQNSAPAA